MKVAEKPDSKAQTQGQDNQSGQSGPAHLAFRQIVVHEFSDGSEPESVRLLFHYREHSKHLLRRGTA